MRFHLTYKRGILFLFLFLIHSQVVHRDLAARNVLVVHNGRRKACKITDFGLSRNIARCGCYTKVTTVSTYQDFILSYNQIEICHLPRVVNPSKLQSISKFSDNMLLIVLTFKAYAFGPCVLNLRTNISRMDETLG